MATAWGAGDVPKGRRPMKDFAEFEAMVASEENAAAEVAIAKEALDDAARVRDDAEGLAAYAAMRYAEAVSLHRLRLYHDWSAM